ncbi:MAG: long-chain fatty acid--CoA ligase [Myxococcaceae bacterium]|nr:long-chain fatty acid--CoA ligase [Myxococcaceae bacterium]
MSLLMEDLLWAYPVPEPEPSKELLAAEALPDTLPARLLELALRHPERVALRHKRLGVWEELTWREYLDGVRAAARGLWELGVRAGDAVAILSDNRPEWLFADLGAQALGALAVGIYQTNPVPDVAYILQDSRARVLLCEDQEQVDKAVACRADTPGVEHVVGFDARGTRHVDDARLLTWDAFHTRGSALLEDGWFEARLAELAPHTPSMVVYTSGTTGQPKGALLSAYNVLDSAGELVGMLDVGPEDSVLSYLPLCHVAEKIFTLYLPLSAGCVVHFGESLDTVREDLREVSPTVFLGVPRIWEKMHASVSLRMKDASWLKRRLFDFFTVRGREVARRRREGRATVADRLLWALGDVCVFRPLQERLGLRRCRLAVTGAAPVSAELLEWFDGVGVAICEGYGQTECAGVSHMTPPGRRRLGSVGRPIPGVECRIAEDGEVLVRGSNVFCGYLHRPDATAETVDADGWLHTGDVGRVDEDGFLFITGRKKELLITSGGKNLSPEKIENALKTSPYIKEAVAIGDGRHFVSALVQLDEEAVSDWATRQRLPHTSYADLAANPAVVDLVAREVDKANALLARVEQVRAFRILPKELHQDDGVLTATQKVRRRAVHAAYPELIESMYGGKSA